MVHVLQNIKKTIKFMNIKNTSSNVVNELKVLIQRFAEFSESVIEILHAKHLQKRVGESLLCEW